MSGPLISGSATLSPEFKYDASVDQTKTLVFSGQGSLYGQLIENNSGSSVYLSCFDAANTGAVTLGVTSPKFTVEIPANGKFGRDSQDVPFHWFSLGCVIAVVSSRNGAGAPASPATVHSWYEKDLA